MKRIAVILLIAMLGCENKSDSSEKIVARSVDDSTITLSNYYDSCYVIYDTSKYVFKCLDSDNKVYFIKGLYVEITFQFCQSNRDFGTFNTTIPVMGAYLYENKQPLSDKITVIEKIKPFH